MAQADVPRVGICGLGLIGGSLLLGLRDAGIAVRGCDAWPEPRAWCAERGIDVDESPEALARAVDVVIVCVPPHATAPVAAAALQANPRAIVLDVASVKRTVVDEVRERAPEATDRFLPAHPLAGGEQGGFGAARPDLLRGAPWAVCPPASDPDGESSSLDLLLSVAPVLDALDARIVACTPDAHDRVVAGTSHAPHVAAGVIADVAVDVERGGPLAAVLSGGGLRDTTRIAGAPASLWIEVLHANSDATADALDAMADRLRAAADAVRTGDRERLERIWATGRTARATTADARWSARDWTSFAAPATWVTLLELGREGVAVRRLRAAPDGARVSGERTPPA
jgi:prephenate dehydrogenase